MKNFILTHPDISSVIFLIIITLVFFYKVFQGLVPIPADLIVGGYYPWVEEGSRVPIKNSLLTDSVSLVYPLRTYAYGLIKQGQLPLWNDKVFGGYPIVGSLPTQLYFPTSLFYLFFTNPVAWSLQTISQIIIALIGMYLLARALKLNSIPSLFASIAYGYSGYSIIYLEWNVQTASSALLPWLILCLDKFLTTKSHRWGVGLSITFALQIFAGYPPITIFSLLAIVLWTLFKTKQWQVILKICLLLALGIGLAAIQLIPALELFIHSQRVYEVIEANEIFLPYQYLISLLAPDFFGNPTTANFFGSGNYLNVALFTGITTLILALLTIINKQLYPQIKPLVILLILALIFVTPNPIASFIYHLGLWGGTSMTMNRSLFLINFTLALLAGFAIQNIPKTSIRKIRMIIIPIFIIFSSLFAYTFIYHQSISTRNLVIPSIIAMTTCGILIFKFIKHQSILLSFLLIIELFIFGWKFTPFTDPKYLYPPTPLTDFLQTHSKDRFVSELDVLPPNMWLPYNLQTIAGYDSYYPLEIAKLIAVINSGRTDATPQTKNGVINHFSSKLLDQSAVKYFITLRRNSNHSIEPDGQISAAFQNPKFKPVFAKGSVIVFENTLAKQRAYLINQPSKPLNYQVITNDHLQINVDSKIADQLVTLDPFYPGWVAQVDGQNVQIQKFQQNFRLIDLPPHAKTVDFYYQPQSLKIGIFISIISLLITMIAYKKFK